MAASPSSVQRAHDADKMTSQINSLIADIVPKLHDLSEQGLREVKAYLEAQLQEARKNLEKATTKVYAKREARVRETDDPAAESR